jgi:hypothetical protein
MQTARGVMDFEEDLFDRDLSTARLFSQDDLVHSNKFYNGIIIISKMSPMIMFKS